jgi:MSHA biogenesis protein MshJ
MDKLKLTLQAYADRIDALSLRERVMVFLAAAAVMFLAYNTFLLEPLLIRQKAQSEGLEQRQKDVGVVEQQIQAILQRRGEDPDAANRAASKQLTEQLGELDKKLLERQSRFVPADRMSRLLESMLRENRRLQVLVFRSVPVIELGSKPAVSAGTQQRPGGASAPIPGLYRHGIELTLRGSYPDLIAYVSALERYQDRFYLGASSLSADSADATLTLNLYTISLSSTWVTF